MPQPGLEPGPFDPESSTLTTGLLTSHIPFGMFKYLERKGQQNCF